LVGKQVKGQHASQTVRQKEHASGKGWVARSEGALDRLEGGCHSIQRLLPLHGPNTAKHTQIV
jgi:hypothetical protein